MLPARQRRSRRAVPGGSDGPSAARDPDLDRRSTASAPTRRRDAGRAISASRTPQLGGPRRVGRPPRARRPSRERDRAGVSAATLGADELGASRATHRRGRVGRRRRRGGAPAGRALSAAARAGSASPASSAAAPRARPECRDRPRRRLGGQPGRPRRRATCERPRPGSAPGGRPAGGREDRLARGQVGAAAPRSRSGRARRTRRRAAGPAASRSRSVTTPVGGQPQRQRQRPLLALRRVGAGRQAVERELELVAVRARPVDTPRRSVVAPRPPPAPRPGPRATPRRLVARRATSAGSTGHLVVGLGQQRGRASSTSVGPGRGQRLAGRRPAWRPTRRG